MNDNKIKSSSIDRIISKTKYSRNQNDEIRFYDRTRPRGAGLPRRGQDPLPGPPGGRAVSV